MHIYIKQTCLRYKDIMLSPVSKVGPQTCTNQHMWLLMDNTETILYNMDCTWYWKQAFIAVNYNKLERALAIFGLIDSD